MTVLKFQIFILVALFSVVACFSVDLPVIKQYYFNQNGERDFNNVVDSVPDAKKQEMKAGYAHEYGYQTYMEAKVNDIIHNGGAYLEGLRRSIEDYSKKLEACNTTETSAPLPETNCGRVTRHSEQVRRLAQLALWVTRQLQDIAYAEELHKNTPRDEREENELILRLAWYLDRLAHLTGYEPESKPYVGTERPSTPDPSPTYGVAMTNDAKMSLIGCINATSNETAVVRCRYPFAMSPLMQQYLNTTGIPEVQSTTQNPESKLEIMEPAEQRRTKRSAQSDPLSHVVQYYIKHHVWINSNPVQTPKGNNFDVPNDLTKVKRSLNDQFQRNIEKSLILKKSKRFSNSFDTNKANEKRKPLLIKKAIILRVPFDAKVSTHKINKKNGVMPKKHRSKRSAFYKKVRQPSVPEDPMQDISYYAKHKRGTNMRPSESNAIQVRLGLQQIYDTGNIEVVRRYGSNYRPGVIPLIDGATRSLTDFK